VTKKNGFVPHRRIRGASGKETFLKGGYRKGSPARSPFWENDFLKGAEGNVWSRFLSCFPEEGKKREYA